MGREGSEGSSSRWVPPCEQVGDRPKACGRTEVPSTPTSPEEVSLSVPLPPSPTVHPVSASARPFPHAHANCHGQPGVGGCRRALRTSPKATVVADSTHEGRRGRTGMSAIASFSRTNLGTKWALPKWCDFGATPEGQTLRVTLSGAGHCWPNRSGGCSYVLKAPATAKREDGPPVTARRCLPAEPLSCSSP